MATERRARILAGRGLHTGNPCCITLTSRPGMTAFRVGEHVATLDALDVVRTDRGVCVKLPPGPVIELVEHLLAAIAASGARLGLEIDVEGGEIPLLDGGAAHFCRAIEQLGPSPCEPDLVVISPGELHFGDATYRFAPERRIALSVTTQFPEPIGRQHATWDGTLATFVRDIAPARTFGFSREAKALAQAGRARYVDRRSVMVFDETGRVCPPGAPMSPDEVARHKLLDLIGDLALYGGPPVGRIEAVRPGHGATHAVVAEALETGILARAFAPAAGRK